MSFPDYFHNYSWLAAKNLKLAIYIILLANFLYLTSLPVDLTTQMLISVSVIAALYLLARFFSRQGLPRIIYIGCSSFLVLRYLQWRLFFTLEYGDLFSFVFALLLFLGELYGILMLFLSVFVNIRPIVREPAKIMEENAECLSVDVFVPSYDEDEELLTITLIGALAMRYPAGKLRVYLLDDGGTVTKRNQKDPEKAKQALKRHLSLQELCKRLGANYLTREKNEKAKAGNMNAAFPKTSGDLILILDADHVPTIDFLEKTAGYFLEDKKLFLVQTPHFFVNPDPIEKNLGLFQSKPSENLMFYCAVQPGLDFWNASFFCGSAAILRREALAETNGFSGDSITEDAETALSLHNKGWNSRYLKYPLISGLQPETFSSFMIQRMRWAQGMVQLFILKNPLKMKGLSIPQKLSYLSSMSFWFFPIPRIIFAFAPIAFLLFGLHIYNATLKELLIYTLPYLAVLIMLSDYLFSKVRWNFISNVYELMQSMYSFGAVIEVLKNPRAPAFSVTPKSERLDEDFISPLAKPFYWMIMGTTLVFFIGVWRLAAFPEERPLIAVALFWVVFNFILYAASLGALLERKQRRLNPRLPADFKSVIVSSNRQLNIPAYVKDISVGGVSLICPELPAHQPDDLDDLHLIGNNPITAKEYRLPIEIKAHWSRNGDHIYGASFKRPNFEQFKDIILLTHGDSHRWEKLMTTCAPDPGFARGMWFLTKSGVIHICKYTLIFTTMIPYRKFLSINKLIKTFNQSRV